MTTFGKTVVPLEWILLELREQTRDLYVEHSETAEGTT